MSTSTISALIANRALCRECIASKAAMKPDAVDAAIIALSRSGVKVDRYANGMCLDCGQDGMVVAIDRPIRR
jgi:hypothetical protein